MANPNAHVSAASDVIELVVGKLGNIDALHCRLSRPVDTLRRLYYVAVKGVKARPRPVQGPSTARLRERRQARPMRPDAVGVCPPAIDEPATGPVQGAKPDAVPTVEGSLPVREGTCPRHRNRRPVFQAVLNDPQVPRVRILSDEPRFPVRRHYCRLTCGVEHDPWPELRRSVPGTSGESEDPRTAFRVVPNRPDTGDA